MSDPIAPDLFERLQLALGTHYRLDRELGRGGMGVVFDATDTALERPVAIKVVHPELVRHEAIVRRFLAEARLIARLRHPNIVTVHQAGSADGLLWYVMDRVPGETLRTRLLREGRLPVEEARRITADVASALDAAARGGVVHRDVKPENILLDPDGRALLVDFGIARAIASDPGIGPDTGRGVAVGTPAYMSPEQAAGEAVDARSDLYALGIVAYEMLAGAPPFAGPSRVVVSKHLSERPLPVQKRRTDCPGPLADAVMQAIEKHPADRWQTGAEFRAALEGAVAARRAARRRRRLALTGGLVALALAAAAITLRAVARDGPPAGTDPRHSILVLPFANVRGDLRTQWLREGAVNMLALTLSQWSDLTVVSPERVHDLMQAAQLRDDDAIGLDLARRLARRAGVWTVVLGEFERSGDTLHLAARVMDVATGRQVDVARVSRPAGDEVRPLFDQLAAQLLDLTGAPEEVRVGLAQATTRSLDAFRAYLAGTEHLNHWELGPAERKFREAIADDSTFGLAYYKLALTRGWIVGADDSVASAAIARAVVHADRLPWREQQMVRGYAFFLEGRPNEARATYEALLQKDHDDPDAWYGLGDAWFHDGSVKNAAARYTQALKAFGRALALDPGYALAYEHVAGALLTAARPNPPFVLVTPDSLALVRPDGGRALDSATVARGREAARQRLVALAREWVNVQPAGPRAHAALFGAELQAGHLDGAEQELGRFRTVAPRHPELPFEAARVRVARNDLSGAAAIMGAALDSLAWDDFKSQVGAADVANRLAAVANLFAYRGNLGRAARVIDLSNRVRFGDPAPRSPEAQMRTAMSWRMLGELYSAEGVPTAALRRIWQDAAEAARSLPAEARGRVLGAGGAAAVGLFTGPTGDASAISELATLAGEPPPREVRALLALERNDTAAARRELGAVTSAPSGEMRKTPYLVYTRPLLAQAWLQLGEYDRALEALDGFDPLPLEGDVFDMRWAALGRVRLLRGAILEKLGRPGEARHQYELALAQWQDADPELDVYVRQARQGLARLEGRG